MDSWRCCAFQPTTPFVHRSAGAPAWPRSGRQRPPGRRSTDHHPDLADLRPPSLPQRNPPGCAAAISNERNAIGDHRGSAASEGSGHDGRGHRRPRDRNGTGPCTCRTDESAVAYARDRAAHVPEEESVTVPPTAVRSARPARSCSSSRTESRACSRSRWRVSIRNDCSSDLGRNRGDRGSTSITGGSRRSAEPKAGLNHGISELCIPPSVFYLT